MKIMYSTMDRQTKYSEHERPGYMGVASCYLEFVGEGKVVAATEKMYTMHGGTHGITSKH